MGSLSFEINMRKTDISVKTVTDTHFQDQQKCQIKFRYTIFFKTYAVCSAIFMRNNSPISKLVSVKIYPENGANKSVTF
jgi:hypothetical protein